MDNFQASSWSRLLFLLQTVDLTSTPPFSLGQRQAMRAMPSLVGAGVFSLV